MNDAGFEEKLTAEAELWGDEFDRLAQSAPPDWRYYRNLRHNIIMHIADVDELLTHIKPGGLLRASDTDGDEALSTVLIAGALCLILPTETSYSDKIRALLKFGVRAPSRVKASIQAEGLSPFEGAGREHDGIKLVEQRFTIEKRVDAPAFTGYITAQLKAPDWFSLPLLKIIRWPDRKLVNHKLLRNTGVILYARKA